MFPQNLEKNILELDRQISLLEMECENIKAETRNTFSKKSSSRPFIREKCDKTFACSSGGPHSLHFMNLFPMPKIHSRSCSRNKTISRTSSFGDMHKPDNISRRHLKKENFHESEIIENEARRGSVKERKETSNVSYEAKKPRKHSVESIREETASSTENYPIRAEIKFGTQKNILTETSMERQIWCDLMKDSVLTDKCRNRKSNNKNSDSKELICKPKPTESKFSSDEELNKSRRKTDSKSLSEKLDGEYEGPHGKILSKRRSRSARTRKKFDEVPVDVDMTKAIHEKEIERFMCDEEEKTDFLLSLNESIRTLHLLIDEMKTKTSREKKNEVLNDMQNILMKISSMKSLNALNVLTPQKKNNAQSSEGEANVTEMKQALWAVKKFCQELSEEKSVISEELKSKNNMIATLLNKEKEYMSLISSLKFNLERMREECEEGKLAKRDLSVARSKLQEEAKVMGALKKNHGKMQALIEEYALENDKLKAEVKISRLESQKFHVLLAAKEVEINKYKQEIESFQKQITQQLNLLRSKATDHEVEHAIEAISNQTNILEAEVDSIPSETTLEKGGLTVFFDRGEINSSNVTSTNKELLLEDTVSTAKVNQEGKSLQLSSSSRELKDVVGANLKDGGFTSCKSDDSMTDLRAEDNYYHSKLHEVLSSSKNLRNSVHEMLQDMRRDSAEKLWPSFNNSNNSSQCSILSIYSENTKECIQRD